MKKFFELYEIVKDNSLVARTPDGLSFEYNRLLFLYLFMPKINKLEGSIIEFGTYKGGTARFMASLTDKIVFTLDTFEGLPYPSKRDKAHIYPKGGLKADYHEVQRFCFMPNIVIKKGLFSETMPQVMVSLFCFAHIDADLYESTKEAIEWVWDKLVKGGMVLCDDYFDTSGGAKKAIDEFLAGKKVKLIKGFMPQLLIVKE